MWWDFMSNVSVHAKNKMFHVIISLKNGHKYEYDQEWPAKFDREKVIDTYRKTRRFKRWLKWGGQLVRANQIALVVVVPIYDECLFSMDSTPKEEDEE